MMATIAIPRTIQTSHTRSSSPHPLSPCLSLDSTASTSPSPIPNKYIPVCPTGPAPSQKPATPPSSPPDHKLSLPAQSILFPTDSYTSRTLDSHVVYELNAAKVAAAVEHISGQPLPDPTQVFPWFHGLHPSNHIQQAFFTARRRNLKKTPKCLRGITLVKAGGDLSRSRLKGALAPDEFLIQGANGAIFKDVDPKEGFSVRNFQIQAAKSAMVSDIVVYGDDEHEVEVLANDIAAAQQAWRELHDDRSHELLEYNTFMCTSPFQEFERRFPSLVAIDSRGCMTGKVMDFFHQERLEMSTMTRASEIHHNIWLGPSPDSSIDPSLSGNESEFDILIECNDLGRLNPHILQSIAENDKSISSGPIHLEFPSSGSIMPPTWSQSEVDALLETCKWLYNLAHGLLPSTVSEHDLDSDGDSQMSTSVLEAEKIRERKILLHCADGYTETTLLGLAYFTYASGLPVATAWLDLHVKKGRNFFAYPSDVALLTTIAPRLYSESPVHAEEVLSDITKHVEEPEWIKNMDGSLPSRVTDYMYLGNLGHANNPDLLRQMGIKQILSVGETVSWRDGEVDCWGKGNIMIVQRVQDNGVDPLTDEFERCLGFIERGKINGTATLVHCRVGVSRSATICIAEVMRSMGLSFPRAYCFVRARRLNVIIQPHLRFSYELLKWEEKLRRDPGQARKFRREMEWPEIARDIAAMNKPYAR